MRTIPHNTLRTEQGAAATRQNIWQLTWQRRSLVLSALMIVIPLGQGEAFAQSTPRPGDEQSNSRVTDSAQPMPRGQPLSPAQLDQLITPIALYPDALVAQILAAATYPIQVVEADRWRQAQGNAPAEQIAAGAESRNWDPSVKALTAFPAVLVGMDWNLHWTADLGNAYYNQPQDLLDAVQAMRQKAEAADVLHSTPQQKVTHADGAITISPANPVVVYVPVYNPGAAYGEPIALYPGYSYAPAPGVSWERSARGLGGGICIVPFSRWPWGWGHWAIGWHDHAIVYNHATYFTRSTTVISYGLNRPGGPPGNFGARGAYVPQPPVNDRAASGVSRPAGDYEHLSGAYGSSNRPISGSTASPVWSAPGYPDRPSERRRASSPQASMRDGPSMSLGDDLDQSHSNPAPNAAVTARAVSDFRPMPPADWRQRSAVPDLWPVDGRISGVFGERTDPFSGEGAFHRGIDIASSYGHSVIVPADGTVVYADFMGGYGRMTEIEHGNGFATRYGHLSGFAVAEGQRVRRGDILGYVGISGRATGPHLHYEVWLHDTPVNPYPYLRITQAQFHGALAGD